MTNWFARYHAYILSRGEQGKHSVKVYAAVWLAPLLAAGLVSFAFRLDTSSKLAFVVPAGLIGLAGVAFVSVNYMKGYLQKEMRDQAPKTNRQLINVYPHIRLPSFEQQRDYPQPEGNDVATLAKAIVRAADCASEAESRRAASDMMYAVGNDHCGDYMPVVLLLLPALEDLLRGNNQWAHYVAIDALSNLWFSHEPAEGFEVFQMPGTQSPVSLKAETRNAIRELLPAIDAAGQGGGPAASWAVDLAIAVRTSAA